ncbi:MAG: FKBP-type peptidyl-prolyl cis-trans isomerase [Bacteroidota bacterium]|jgi:FKBP-type peptidyl-prolyl cis-trans isomerase SlyD
MTIQENKVVSLVYQLRVDGKEGDIVETVQKEKPFVFLYGAGNLLPKFEEELSGLKAGDTFEFAIDADSAYGQASDEAILDLPRHIFEVDGKIDEEIIKVGNVVPMQDKDGNKFNGIILEMKDDAIKVDFNHPLAGDDLFFQGEVMEVRDANEEEAKQGFVE